MAVWLRAPASVAFEDVMVGLSPEEWAVLADWQRELYWDVMKENYTLVASLASAPALRPSRSVTQEVEEELNVGAFQRQGGRGISPVPRMGSDDAQSDVWVAAKHRAGPCIWDGWFVWTPQFSSILLHQGQAWDTHQGQAWDTHQGQAWDTQSCLRMTQVPVAFEDVTVCFSPEEWGGLVQWQRELYRAVMRENYELVASLGSAYPEPARRCEIQRGDEPDVGEPWQGQERETPDTGDGIWRHVPEMPGEAQKSLGGAAAVPGHQEKVLNTCKDCGQSFSERGILIVHVLRTHLAERAVPCAECGKLLSSRGRRVAHQQAHVRERTFTCVECKRSVVYEKHWVEKVRMELAGGKPFKCTQCSYRIILMVDQLASRERGAFPCPHCQKVFPTAHLLELHQPLHAGEVAWACAECGQRFRRRNMLHKHRRSRSDETPIACRECSQSFPFQCSSKKHVQGHAREWPFPCAQCGRRFHRRGFLATHLRAHAARQPPQGSQRDHALERPCPECGQVFGSQEAWAAHQRVHGRLMPFTCAECGKSFMPENSYTRHPRQHMGASPVPGRPAILPEGAAGMAPAPPRGTELRPAVQGCPTGELGPAAGPANPSACDPGPGTLPAWALASLGQREGIFLRS